MKIPNSLILLHFSLKMVVPAIQSLVLSTLAGVSLISQKALRQLCLYYNSGQSGERTSTLKEILQSTDPQLLVSTKINLIFVILQFSILIYFVSVYYLLSSILLYYLSIQLLLN